MQKKSSMPLCYDLCILNFLVTFEVHVLILSTTKNTYDNDLEQ